MRCVFEMEWNGELQYPWLLPRDDHLTSHPNSVLCSRRLICMSLSPFPPSHLILDIINIQLWYLDGIPTEWQRHPHTGNKDKAEFWTPQTHGDGDNNGIVLVEHKRWIQYRRLPTSVCR